MNYIMKNYFWVGLACLVLCSCQKTFYQVCTAKSDDVERRNDSLVYEDGQCIISYNLWGNYGNAGFMFYNKTDENIYIDLHKTSFVRNGYAYDYYKNRTYIIGRSVASMSGVTAMGVINVGYQQNLSESVSQNITGLVDSPTGYYLGNIGNNITKGIGVAKSWTKGLAVSKGVKDETKRSLEVKEAEIICIPPHSKKMIREYSIQEGLYTKCGLRKFPAEKDRASETFDEASSPMKFRNVIYYSVGEDNLPIVVENDFHVISVTNYTSKQLLGEKIIKKDCMGNALRRTRKMQTVYFFKDSGPDKFYIKYNGRTSKHRYF